MKLLADRAAYVLFCKILFFTVAFGMVSAGLLFFLPGKAAICIVVSALCMFCALWQAVISIFWNRVKG